MNSKENNRKNGKNRKKSNDDRSLQKRLKKQMTKRANKMSWRKKKQSIKGQKEDRLLQQLKEHMAWNNKIENQTEDNCGAAQKTTNELDFSEQQSKAKKCHYSVSIALPGSILNNAQSYELRAYLAGQIARAAAVFCVDEVIVFDETAQLTQKEIEQFESGNWPNYHSETNNGNRWNCNFHLARILQFLECPQYLRKRLFPLQKPLKHAGLLNPLDCPHHLRSDDLTVQYREAVVLDKPVKEGRGSFCDAGFSKDVQIDRVLVPDLRITLKLTTTDINKKHLKGRVISPKEPFRQSGLYWGYTVRVVSSLSDIIKSDNNNNNNNAFDLVIGTSDKGESVDTVDIPDDFKKLLVVFGGLGGLEWCLNDKSSSNSTPVPKPLTEMFDFYINCLPNQGSRTIRTEEAVLITLSALRAKIRSRIPS